MLWRAGLVLLLGCQHSVATGAAPAPAAQAYEGPPKRILVELFTSQGCDSCPAADALVGELPALGWTRDEVVPLTFHVTYWDDLGWQDPYARPLFDQRQITYAHAVSAARAKEETTIEGPYTPQMVVDGRVHFSGALKDVAQEEIGRAREAPTLIEMDVVAKPQATVDVHVRSRATDANAFDTSKAKVGLFAALAQRELETAVPRGENAGKTLQEHWVVRDFAGPKLFRSDRGENETGFALEMPAETPPGEFEVVVFAQELASLRIVGVATSVLE